MPQQKFVTCLWFRDQAEEAMRFYMSLFPGSEIASEWRGPDGSLITANFRMHGQEWMVLNGNRNQPFTDACSIVARCESQTEVDRLWDALLKDGGKPTKCGWLKDRFGVSWQIVPTELDKLLAGKDRAGVDRVVQALLKMDKIEIAELRRAYEGEGR